MNEPEIAPDQIDNYLFTFLGAVCAVVVGLAFFGTTSNRSPASAESPRVILSPEDARTELPILD